MRNLIAQLNSTCSLFLQYFHIDGLPQTKAADMMAVHGAYEEMGVPKGTEAFAAPEAYNRQFSTKSDVWAVGVFVYQWFVNAPPSLDEKGKVILVNRALKANDREFPGFLDLMSKILCKVYLCFLLLSDSYLQDCIFREFNFLFCSRWKNALTPMMC